MRTAISQAAAANDAANLSQLLGELMASPCGNVSTDSEFMDMLSSLLAEEERPRTVGASLREHLWTLEEVEALVASVFTLLQNKNPLSAFWQSVVDGAELNRTRHAARIKFGKPFDLVKQLEKAHGADARASA